MKKTIQLITVCCLMIVAIAACKKADTPASNQMIDPADANALQKVLTIQGGSLGAGNIPTATATGSAPSLGGYQSSSATNPGSKLILPFNYTSSAGYKALYVQVAGATNGYFTITNPNASGSGAHGTILLYISIPTNVNPGYFDLKYTLVDNNNNVSTYVTTSCRLSSVLTCTSASVSGAEGLTFTTVQMDSVRGGTASVNYNTYSIPDRIDIYQGSTWLTGTGTNPNSQVPPQCNCDTLLPGFVGQAASLPFSYNPANGHAITVVVSGCLGGGTAWDWNMSCPQ